MIILSYNFLKREKDTRNNDMRDIFCIAMISLMPRFKLLQYNIT